MNPRRRVLVHKIAAFITELRQRGCSQQTVMLAVDREYPSISYKEFLGAVLLHEIARETTPEKTKTLH